MHSQGAMTRVPADGTCNSDSRKLPSRPELFLKSSVVCRVGDKLGGAWSDFNVYRLHCSATYLASKHAESHVWLNVATSKQLSACLEHRNKLTASKPGLSQLHVLISASHSPCVRIQDYTLTDTRNGVWVFWAAPSPSKPALQVTGPVPPPTKPTNPWVKTKVKHAASN